MLDLERQSELFPMFSQDLKFPTYLVPFLPKIGFFGQGIGCPVAWNAPGSTRQPYNNNFIPFFTSYNQFMYNVKNMAQPPDEPAGVAENGGQFAISRETDKAASC